MDVVGGDPGDEPDGEEHDDRRKAGAPGKQLRAHGEHHHEPEAREQIVS